VGVFFFSVFFVFFGGVSGWVGGGGVWVVFVFSSPKFKATRLVGSIFLMTVLSRCRALFPEGD